MGITKAFLECFPGQAVQRVCDLISFPPLGSWPLQQMYGESHLLRVGALTSHQVLVHRAQPIICHNWLSCSGELIRPEPQKSCKSIHVRRWWWWRWRRILIGHELSHHSHQLSLRCDHLLKHSTGDVVVIVGIATGRHLWLRIDEYR